MTSTASPTLAAARTAQIPAEHAALAAVLQAGRATLTDAEVATLAAILNRLSDEYLDLTGQRLG